MSVPATVPPAPPPAIALLPLELPDADGCPSPENGGGLVDGIGKGPSPAAVADDDDGAAAADDDAGEAGGGGWLLRRALVMLDGVDSTPADAAAASCSFARERPML